MVLFALAAILLFLAVHKFIGFSVYTMGALLAGSAFFKLKKKTKTSFQCGLVYSSAETANALSQFLFAKIDKNTR